MTTESYRVLVSMWPCCKQVTSSAQTWVQEKWWSNQSCNAATNHNAMKLPSDQQNLWKQNLQPWWHQRSRACTVFCSPWEQQLSKVKSHIKLKEVLQRYTTSWAILRPRVFKMSPVESWLERAWKDGREKGCWRVKKKIGRKRKKVSTAVKALTTSDTSPVFLFLDTFLLPRNVFKTRRKLQ